MRAGTIAMAVFVALGLATMLPSGTNAAIGWSLTAEPNKLTQGTLTDVELRMTNTSSGSTIGCLEVRVPAGIQVRDATIVDTTAGGAWKANVSGSDPTSVVLQADGAAGRLRQHEWVDFVITVRPREPGRYAWTAETIPGNDCKGIGALPPQTLEFVVSPAPATAAPTSTPVAQTPSPTVQPTVKPTATAKPEPTATARPTATVAPTATARPTATAAPTVAPSAAPSVRPTATTTDQPPTSPSLAPGPTEPPSAPSSNAAANDTRPTPSADGGVASIVEPLTASLVPAPDGAAAVLGGGLVTYEMPDSLYHLSDQLPVADILDTMLSAGAPANWIIPGLVTGVPGLLLIVLVVANVMLGVSWLPNVGRLLGPEPPLPDEETHAWWASGRPPRE